jgi:hypothetical protein
MAPQRIEPRRTSTDVVPVRIIRSQLLVMASFDEVYPDRDLKFARPLEMGGIRLDERVSAGNRNRKFKQSRETVRDIDESSVLKQRACIRLST